MVILDVGLNLAWCRHNFPFWFRYMAPLTWTLGRGSVLANLRENGDAVPRITSSDRALHFPKRRMIAINCHRDLRAQTRLAQPDRHAAGGLP
jgi:hypothetical protein